MDFIQKLPVRRKWKQHNLKYKLAKDIQRSESKYNSEKRWKGKYASYLHWKEIIVEIHVTFLTS